MTTRHPRGSLAGRLATATLTAALLGGCTGGAGEPDDGPLTIRPGAPGEEGEILDEAPEREATPPNDADLAFVADMLVHHEQALVMAALVDDRSTHDSLPLLAERIEVSQEAEIELLRSYLESHGHDPSDHDGHDGHDGMPGMLTDDELAALAAADGEDFDRQFLTSMIVHHLGAIEMVDAHAAGGGADPEVEQLAGHIRAEQETEILRMQEVLADLDD